MIPSLCCDSQSGPSIAERRRVGHLRKRLESSRETIGRVPLFSYVSGQRRTPGQEPTFQEVMTTRQAATGCFPR